MQTANTLIMVNTGLEFLMSFTGQNFLALAGPKSFQEAFGKYMRVVKHLLKSEPVEIEVFYTSN